jgi:hypothetical protein
VEPVALAVSDGSAFGLATTCRCNVTSEVPVPPTMIGGQVPVLPRVGPATHIGSSGIVEILLNTGIVGGLEKSSLGGALLISNAVKKVAGHHRRLS